MTRFLSMVNLVHTQEKNRKIQNLKISHLSENLSRRKRPSKLGLDTLKLRVAPFFSLFSFLSFFRLGRTPSLQRERWSTMPWTRTKEERRLSERQEREPRVLLRPLKEKSR